MIETRNASRIYVEEIRGSSSPSQGRVEIVERKGLGHPDTICDLVMEQVSQELSKSYIQKFDRILHHNCDKGLLVAGRTQHRLGGGRVVEPMRLVIGDRATLVPELDVAGIAVETAKAWFRKNLPEIDPDRHLTYQVEFKGGSQELTSIFRKSAIIAPANDTSAAVGYAPLSETERLVLAAERFLNGSEFKQSYPASGQDVKIMAVRHEAHLDVTVAMPLLDRYIDSEALYFEHKEKMRRVLTAYLQSRLDGLDEITVSLNTLDSRGAGIDGMYLSVLGTSAEDADSGEVGRGNQVNGIIALNRPRGSEAAAGKNPVSHVGKIYNVLTHRLAEQIYREVAGLEDVVVWLCSQIGMPVNEPQVAAVQVRLKAGLKISAVSELVRRVVSRELERMPQFCSDLAQGKYAIC